MEYAVSAYIDATRGLMRAHCEYNQRSLEVAVAILESGIETLLSFLPRSTARQAITSVTRSSFGDHTVITASFPRNGNRG